MQLTVAFYFEVFVVVLFALQWDKSLFLRHWWTFITTQYVPNSMNNPMECSGGEVIKRRGIQSYEPKYHKIAFYFIYRKQSNDIYTPKVNGSPANFCGVLSICHKQKASRLRGMCEDVCDSSELGNSKHFTHRTEWRNSHCRLNERRRRFEGI